jgi:uncharacterized protein (DUF1697 family)
MLQYTVFLRAINVGGHNSVKKEKLQKAFVALGFRNVLTYKQSGNVIFETNSKDRDAIEKEIKQQLQQLLGRDVGVFMRTMKQLTEIVDMNAFKNEDSAGTSFLVTFFDKPPENSLPLPMKIPNSDAQIILVKGMEAFSVTHGYGDGGKPNPFLESKLKVHATTRNLNVLKEIIQMCSETNKGAA